MADWEEGCAVWSGKSGGEGGQYGYQNEVHDSPDVLLALQVDAIVVVRAMRAGGGVEGWEKATPLRTL